ncbi:hypothetical protein BJ971_004986 [Actinoplanes digitatis]|uniref:Uncharacterized protein n=1 Tax=Actinoplanes digitatis TaxID=1868 RepID=A0A7W7I137_9ACTN|nr:hypothetical protein [Actinoplanes digitatis]
MTWGTTVISWPGLHEPSRTRPFAISAASSAVTVNPLDAGGGLRDVRIAAPHCRRTHHRAGDDHARRNPDRHPATPSPPDGKRGSHAGACTMGRSPPHISTTVPPTPSWMRSRTTATTSAGESAGGIRHVHRRSWNAAERELGRARSSPAPRTSPGSRGCPPTAPARGEADPRTPAQPPRRDQCPDGPSHRHTTPGPAPERRPGRAAHRDHGGLNRLRARRPAGPSTSAATTPQPARPSPSAISSPTPTGDDRRVGHDQAPPQSRPSWSALPTDPPPMTPTT